MTSNVHSIIARHTDGTATVSFQKSLYNAAAVKKAAYKFAAQFGIVLNDTAECTQACISFLDTTDEKESIRQLHAFCNEVIDQDLREQLAEQTESTRNLILAQAFSKTSLLNEN